MTKIKKHPRNNRHKLILIIVLAGLGLGLIIAGLIILDANHSLTISQAENISATKPPNPESKVDSKNNYSLPPALQVSKEQEAKDKQTRRQFLEQYANSSISNQK